MPILNTDSNLTWILTEPNQTWTIPNGIAIDTASSHGVIDQVGNNRIQIMGDVLGHGGTIGVDYLAGSTVLVGESGWISGFNTAVQTGNDGGRVVNHGLIEGFTGIFGRSGTVENDGDIISGGNALTSGVNYSGQLDLRNSGTISGDYAVALEGGTIENSAAGRITGDIVALSLGDAAQASRIENFGIIRARLEAVIAQGQVSIVNHGKIIGDIKLGEHADRIDTRGGLVKGVIDGGEGDDVYLVSSSDLKIDDTGASFFDVVKSTVGFGLSGGLDELVLLGRKNIDGTGSIHDDILRGNSGDNKLYGRDGNDVLEGGDGRDRLQGGSGTDEFRFERGDGKDVINDFADGEDFISSSLVKSARDFARLDIRQAGADTVIDFGQGDAITIEDFKARDLEVDSFMMPLP